MIRRDAATTKSDCPNKQTTRRREWSEAPGSHLQVPEVAQRPLAQVSRHVAGLVEGVDDRLLGVVGHGGAPNVAKRPHRLRIPSGKGFRQTAPTAVPRQVSPPLLLPAITVLADNA